MTSSNALSLSIIYIVNAYSNISHLRNLIKPIFSDIYNFYCVKLLLPKYLILFV